MSNPPVAEQIGQLIRNVRDQRVILDVDLAAIYAVQTRVLNQAVKRNQDRFPDDFVIALTRDEILSMSQSVTSLARLRFSKQVHAFNEHGALMAASVLNSPPAVKMSLYLVRAFVKLREEKAANSVILKRLAEIDKTLLEHNSALRTIWTKLQPLLAPPPEPPRRRIGFQVNPDKPAASSQRKS